MEPLNTENYKQRLQSSVRGVAVSPELEERVRRSLREARVPRRPGWLAGGAIAATVLLCLAGLRAFEHGQFRFTQASREAYIHKISQPLPPLMRVGLGDHVHCAVYREYPSTPPSLEQCSVALGPGYRELLPALNGKIPAAYHLAMAHRCSYEGRQFVHLTFKDRSSVLSVLIANREWGEGLERQNSPVAQMLGLPLYQAAAQRFEVAAFETPAHLVYVISDLPARRNMEMMTALVQPVRAVLLGLES